MHKLDDIAWNKLYQRIDTAIRIGGSDIECVEKERQKIAKEYDAEIALLAVSVYYREHLHHRSMYDFSELLLHIDKRIAEIAQKRRLREIGINIE